MSFNSSSRRAVNSNGKHYNNRDHFKDNLRVLRKNLLFCSGLPLYLTDAEIRSKEYFGKYGKVSKVILLKSLRQMSAYITYSDNIEASLAVLATNGYQFDRHHNIASLFGTIKYCKYFLKKIQCKNLPNCNYLHVLDRKNEIYIDSQLPDEVFEEHEEIALETLQKLDIHKTIQEKKWTANDPNDPDDNILPCPIQAIKEIFQETCIQYQLKQQQKNSETKKQKKDAVLKNSQQLPVLATADSQKPKEDQVLMQNRERPQSIDEKSQESLEIKLIRKLVREPESKLNSWIDTKQRQQDESNLQLFHVGLSELNELKENCENNIVQQNNRQEERLKFLLIKQIHHSAENEQKTLIERTAVPQQSQNRNSKKPEKRV